MRLSARVEYGVRAMAVLATAEGGVPLSLRLIAEREHISLSFLEQIFPDLKKEGLVESKRGARGGYVLSRPALEIRIGDIVRAVDGPISPVDCLEQGNNVSSCSHRDGCRTRFVWEKLRDRINDVLDGVTLGELAECRPPGRKQRD